MAVFASHVILFHYFDDPKPFQMGSWIFQGSAVCESKLTNKPLSARGINSSSLSLPLFSTLTGSVCMTVSAASGTSGSFNFGDGQEASESEMSTTTIFSSS